MDVHCFIMFLHVYTCFLHALTCFNYVFPSDSTSLGPRKTWRALRHVQERVVLVP